jgi:hypothetical protein
MAFKSFLKFLGVRQNSKPELIAFKIDTSDTSAVTTGTGGIDEGKNYATVLNSATGTYVFTFNRVCRRTPVILGAAPVTIDARFAITAIDTAGFTIVWEVGGTDTDMDFDVSVLCFFDDKER